MDFDRQPDAKASLCARRKRVICGLLVSVSIMIFSGCQSSTKSQRPTSIQMRSGDEWRDVDPQRMTRDLQLFTSEFAAEVSGTASEIASTTRDRRIREMTLMWRLKTIPIIEMAILIPDPRQALVAMWLITAEQQDYLTIGRGRNIFGDQQHLAIQAANSLEERIEEVAQRYYTEEQIAEAIQDVKEFSEASPVMAIFDLYDPMALSSGSLDNDGIGGILAAPLSPFKALGGIGDVPTELHRISLTMLAFSRMVEQQPEHIRWQLELLMLELESGETLTEARRSMNRATTSMESISKTAEKLPASLRAEFDLALESLDQRHEKISQSLDQAMQVSADIRGTSENLKQVAALADQRLDETRELVQQASETADAWKATSQSANELIQSIDGLMTGMRENRREDAPTFDINDYARTATEIRSTVEDLNALLNDAQSAEFNVLMQRLDDSSRTTIDYAGLRMDAIVDRVTIRMLMVLGVLVVVMMGYRMVSARLAARKA